MNTFTELEPVAEFGPVAAFRPGVVSAVLAHMKSDHGVDKPLIARAFADPAAACCARTTLDGEAGYWRYSAQGGRAQGGRAQGGRAQGGEAAGVEVELRMPWAVRITERAEIRREIVSLCDRANARLGISDRTL